MLGNCIHWDEVRRNYQTWVRSMTRPPSFGLCPGLCRVSKDADGCVLRLARISHRWSAAPPQSSALAALRSVGLLDVLHEYDCGGLGRKPCQDGPFGASLRQAMRNAG